MFRVCVFNPVLRAEFRSLWEIDSEKQTRESSSSLWLSLADIYYYTDQREGERNARR